MDRFKLYQTWLLIVSICIAAFGLVLAVFPQSGLMNTLLNNHINPVFFGDTVIPETMIPFQAWAYGVLGATVAGWGIFMVFVVQVPFRGQQRWAWLCLAVSFTLWFIVDTSISAYYHVYFNVWFNTALYLAVVVPLAVTYKYFMIRTG